jgi:hypothetical protein
MRKGIYILMKRVFSVINVYDIEKGDSDFVGDYGMYRNTSVNHKKQKRTTRLKLVQGEGGKKGLMYRS